MRGRHRFRIRQDTAAVSSETPAGKPAPRNPPNGTPRTPMTIYSAPRTTVMTQFTNGRGRIVCTASTAFKSRGRVVQISTGGSSFTVVVNPSRRSLGKTYANADALLAAYKTMRAELVEAVRIINTAAVAAVTEQIERDRPSAMWAARAGTRVLSKPVHGITQQIGTVRSHFRDLGVGMLIFSVQWDGSDQCRSLPADHLELAPMPPVTEADALAVLQAAE